MKDEGIVAQSESKVVSPFARASYTNTVLLRCHETFENH